MADVENATEDEIQDDTGEAEELCLCCLAPLPPTANFCRQCGGPTGFLAGTMPFERVLAEGFVFHRAIQSPRSLMSVLGIWVLFIGDILYGVLFLSAYWQWKPYARGFSDHLIQFENLIGSGLILVGIAAIWQTTLNYLCRERVTDDET